MLENLSYKDLPTRRRFLLLLASSAAGTAWPRAWAQTPPLGTDLEGRPVASLAAADSRMVVALFIASDCPLSNRYLPEILQLEQQFRPRGVRFWLVYPNPADDLAAVRAHQQSFAGAASLDTLIAPHPRLISQAGVRVTPEAALFRAPSSPEQPSLWHGRIDDRYLSIGTQRRAPTRRDLAEALETALNGGSPAPATGHAVGCTIIPRDFAAPGDGTGSSADCCPGLSA